ncbi:anti-sigma factor domain-containing protein [Sporolactobacillus terrae]|uniref:anti-sigma factor domain-containing protein n=1 Tax=Sporolactobacillus terrae TaxID=269673 RepID=UPI003B5AA3D6
MSKRGRRAIVLTDDGDFKSVHLTRTARLSIGQTVTAAHLAHFFLLPKSLMIPMMALSISVLCFLPLSHSSYAPPGPVAAYVYFDLKASVEASVDRNMNIISVQPLNQEAKQFIQERPMLQNGSFQELSAALLSKLGKDSGSSLCIVTSVLTDQISRSQRTDFTSGLTAAFKSSTRRAIKANGIGVQWLHTSLQQKRAAEARGLSAGKYLLYLNANAYGKTLSLDDARQLSAEKIRERSASLSLPWRALFKETKSIRANHPKAEQAVSDWRHAHPLFQNPFQSRERFIDQRDSGYHDLNSRTACYA